MSAHPCGCPPSEPGPPGRVHHVFLNVADLARSRAFFGWLLPRLGYAGRSDYPGASGWWGDGGSIWIKPADASLSRDGFDKDRVGLCEIAFAAPSRAAVDALHAELVARDVTVLDPPRAYDYTPGYYAVFFADPDGMKLEYVHIPMEPAV
jgi:glyoxylase I family protein